MSEMRPPACARRSLPIGGSVALAAPLRWLVFREGSKMHKASHRDMLALGVGADIACLGVLALAATAGNPNETPQ
jgi:hypothetical protein